MPPQQVENRQQDQQRKAGNVNSQQKQQPQQQQARQESKSKDASAEKQNPKEFAIKEGRQKAAGDWAAEELLDMNVIGKEGKEIGSVENLLINEQGQIVAVIAQMGGVLDIGDTHVAVSWKEVSIKNGKVRAPITKDNAADYSIFKEQYFSKFDVGTKTTVQENLNTGPQI